MSIRNALEELLLIVEIHQKCTKNNFAWAEVEYAKELFAQPEQTEQTEPVAWCQMAEGKVQDLLTSFEMKDWIKDDSWTPLYTAPPKRERLSEDRLRDISNSINTYPDFENVSVWQAYYIARTIEKAHGIGGEE